MVAGLRNFFFTKINKIRPKLNTRGMFTRFSYKKNSPIEYIKKIIVIHMQVVLNCVSQLKTLSIIEKIFKKYMISKVEVTM